MFSCKMESLQSVVPEYFFYYNFAFNLCASILCKHEIDSIECLNIPN